MKQLDISGPIKCFGQWVGKFYISKQCSGSEEASVEGIHLREYSGKMDLAYAVADCDCVQGRCALSSIWTFRLLVRPVDFWSPSQMWQKDPQTKSAWLMSTPPSGSLVCWGMQNAVGQLKSKVDENYSVMQQSMAELGLKIKRIGKANAAKPPIVED